MNNSDKYVFKSNMLDHENDDMPPQYQHITHGPCSVKPEYYITMHKLKSELHSSEVQGAICTVANNLFGNVAFFLISSMVLGLLDQLQIF